MNNKKVSYVRLSREILDEIIMKLAPISEKDNKEAFVSILLDNQQKSEAINIAIIYYINYINYILGIQDASKYIPIRQIITELFREITEYTYDESVKIIEKRLRKEFNSAKRRERYKREKALEIGEDYYSEIVDFGDVDMSKIVKPEEKSNISLTNSDNEIINIEKTDNTQKYTAPTKPRTSQTDNTIVKNSDEFDVYEMLAKTKAQTISESNKIRENEQKQSEQNRLTKVTSPTLTTNNDNDNVIDVNPNADVDMASAVTNIADNKQEQFIDDITETYNIKTIDSNNYVLLYDIDDYKFYDIIITGRTQNRLTTFGNFIPIIDSIVHNNKRYIDKDTLIEMTVSEYRHKLIIQIATNENILEIVDHIKLYPELSRSVFDIRKTNKPKRTGYISIIEK